MFKKMWFWILFFILSVSAIFYVAQEFPQVMSFISIDITMNREEAFEQTNNLAAGNGWGTEDFRQVAVFDSDGGQTYVELEGGGKTAFNKLLQNEFFSYYYWDVRNYKPGELLDSFTYFKPTGEPYGFRVNYPEELDLPNLEMAEALDLAKAGAAADWSIDFSKYDLNDEKLVTKPNGRKDYIFIFERNGEKINEAKFLLELQVTGDKFSKLEHSLKIPEAFSRRYTEMRSANNTIAGVGSIMMIIFYGILGIIFGAFFLIKSKWLLWKKALLWAVFIAFLEFIASFNYLSLSWIYYQTTSSVTEHIMRNVASSITGFISTVLLLSISFMVAESLTRKAFGKKTQLWKNWSSGVANSKKTLGNTLGAYLWVPISLTYILVFYTITTNYLGWWNSSSLNIDPNTLATPFPWLGAISRALHAGFWEECLFRAVPLAGAILIGRKLNKEKLFFWIGMILQVVIFGMGHANYPAQPSYARVIELIFPSIMFAVAYLRFGLLTGILIHFVFDAVLMSMPIWMVQPKEMMGNKVLFVLALMVPFLVILFRYIKEKKMVDEDEESLNEKWKPIPPIQIETNEQQAVTETKIMNKKMVYVLGIIGIVLSLLLFHQSFDGKQLEINKQEAIELSKDFLKTVDVDNIEEFEVFVNNESTNVPLNQLYWNRLGREQYNELSDTFIKNNIIYTRFVKFEGDLQDRAEEFSVYLARDGKIVRYLHNFHEESVGVSLQQKEALAMAKDFVDSIYKINSEELTLINALPEKKDNRRDWTFAFKDTINYQLADDEIIYNVSIAGDELKYIFRTIKVPEKDSMKFFSDFYSRNSVSSLIRVVNTLMVVAALIITIIGWTKKEMNMKVFLTILASAFVILLINTAFTLNDLIIQFSTSEPFGNQMLMRLVMKILLGLGASFFMAIILGYFANNIKQSDKKLQSILIAFIPLGFFYLVGGMLPQLRPAYAVSDALVSSLPIYTAIYLGLKSFFLAIALFIPTYIVLDKISVSFTKRIPLVIFTLFLMIASIAIKGTFVNMISAEIISWLVVSAVVTAVYYLIIQKFIVHNPTSLVWAAAIIAILKTASNALMNAYPGAFVYNLVTVFIIIAATYIVDSLIRK